MNSTLKKYFVVTSVILLLFCGCIFLCWAAFAIGYEAMGSRVEGAWLRAALNLVTNPDVVLGGCGVILAVLSIAAAYIIFQAQATNEQYSRMVEGLISSDPLGAIREIRRGGWPAPRSESLRRDESFCKRLLVQLNTAFEHSILSDSLLEKLKEVERFYATFEIEKHLKCCRSDDQAKKVESALWLWEKYDEDVRNIVIRILQNVDQGDGRALLEERFRKGTENELRLLRDRRPGMELERIAPDLISYEYHWQDWAPLWNSQSVTPDDVLQSWLALNELRYHPFPTVVAEDDYLLQNSWALPDRWTEIQNPEPLIIRSDYAYDRVATARMLCDELRRSQIEKCFPILFELPSPALAPNATAVDALHGIAVSAAETWVGLLSRHPWAFLELDPVNEVGLTQFLTWVVGTPELLKRKLQQAFEELPQSAKEKVSPAARDMARERIDRLRNNHLPFSPSTPQLLKWISYRPPGLARSYVIAYHNRDDDAALPQLEQQAEVVLSWAGYFSQVNVALKLLAPTSILADTTRNLGSIDLGWSDERLLQALDRRVELANYKSWAGLFDGSLSTISGRLVEKAGGSYGRMVKIAHRTIQIHVQKTPNDQYLTARDQADAVVSIDSP